MAPQLTTQQLLHAIENLEKRVKAKKLEIHALSQLRTAAVDVIAKHFNFRDEEKQQPAQDAVHNYLTAKMNQELVTLEELDLTLKAYKQMSSGIVVPVPSFNSKNQ